MASATTALVTSTTSGAAVTTSDSVTLLTGRFTPSDPGWAGTDENARLPARPEAGQLHVTTSTGSQGSQLGHRHASDEDDNVGGTPSRRPQCRTAEQAIRRMSEEAPGDPGRHLVDALVSISPDRGRLPTDRRPTRRRKDSAVDVPLGCPLPAVLPAVSRSVRRFLTRSDPQSPSVFPTNAGFLGDFAESGTGSKPGTRGTSSRSSARSTGDSGAAAVTTRAAISSS